MQTLANQQILLPQILTYDINKYPLIDMIKSLFDVTDLDLIHKTIEKEYQLFDKPGIDSSTHFHSMFYDRLRSGWDEFLQVYKQLIIENCNLRKCNDNSDSNECFIYQKWPTFRVHLPNNLAVGAWHTDNEYHHPEGEVNFILPLTKMFESNTVVTESEPGKRDFRQIELDIGQIYVFNGNKCLHGNLPNRTGKTRMSIDFRLIWIDDYNKYLEDRKADGRSMTTNREFILGSYYDRV